MDIYKNDTNFRIKIMRYMLYECLPKGYDV